MNIQITRSMGASSLALLIALLSISVPSQASATQSPEQSLSAASIEAWKRAKYPWLYPTTTAQSDDSNVHFPVPGSFAAIMAVKDPAHYGPHLPAADEPSKPNCTLRPGSWEAIMSVKVSQHYGPCGKR